MILFIAFFYGVCYLCSVWGLCCAVAEPPRTYQNVMQRKEEGARQKQSTRHILPALHALFMG